MICLGLAQGEKIEVVERYTKEHGISHVVWLSYWMEEYLGEQIAYDDIIEYHVFYRLLQEIKSDSLLVIDECLRTTNRNDLTYNCIRHYLSQTNHQIIFQHLPMIENKSDFMVLVDFDTKSKWRRRPFHPDILRGLNTQGKKRELSFQVQEFQAPSTLEARYQKEKEKLFKMVSSTVNKDPHIIPRRLHLLGGKERVHHGGVGLFANGRYVMRNKRLGLGCVDTYKEATGNNYTIADWPHAYKEFTDFLYRTKQDTFGVLSTSLKVDRWYTKRYQDWRDELNELYTSL